MTRHTDSLQLSSRMEDTREGFLLCRDVALARTGTQSYMSYEVPGVPAKNGRVTVERTEDEVFSPEAIASFSGKPLTDDHPTEDVAPKNFRRHIVGVIQNPRRGVGDQANCLVADIMVYDPEAIKKIKSKDKRELSCGYDAGYESIEPGRARQTNIRGNHVSLVDEGRCGPTCSIKDGKTNMAVKIKDKKSFLDKLSKLFSAKDEAEREDQMAALGSELQPDGDDGNSNTPSDDTDTNADVDSGKGGGSHHHVTVNIGGSMQGPHGTDSTDTTSDDGTAPDGEESGLDTNNEDSDDMCTKADLQAALQPMMDEIANLKAQVADMSGDVEDVTDPDDTMTQDAVARAEVLKPGISLPTFDSKPGSKSHKAAIVGFKRAALAESFGTQDGKTVISAFSGSARPNFKAMSDGEVNILFNAASQAMHDANEARQEPQARATYLDASTGKKKVMDSAAINEINRKYWNRKTA